MTVIETLTPDQLISLQDAQDKVTIEMLESLEYGEEIRLTDYYTLYHYSEDDIFVIVLDIRDEWTEVLQVLYSDTDIVFEAL